MRSSGTSKTQTPQGSDDESSVSKKDERIDLLDDEEKEVGLDSDAAFDEVVKKANAERSIENTNLLNSILKPIIDLKSESHYSSFLGMKKRLTVNEKMLAVDLLSAAEELDSTVSRRDLVAAIKSELLITYTSAFIAGENILKPLEKTLTSKEHGLNYLFITEAADKEKGIENKIFKSADKGQAEKMANIIFDSVYNEIKGSGNQKILEKCIEAANKLSTPGRTKWNELLNKSDLTTQIQGAMTMRNLPMNKKEIETATTAVILNLPRHGQ